MKNAMRVMALTAVLTLPALAVRRMVSIIWCAGLIALSALGTVQAQTNLIQGTPGSLFPSAGPNKIQMINGVPCQTMYDRQQKARVVNACAGEVSVHRVS
jgi:hypothetical protein